MGTQEVPPGAQAPWWRDLGWGRAQGAPGLPGGPLAAPHRLYLPLAPKTLEVEPFSRSLLCSATIAVSRLGLSGDPV